MLSNISRGGFLAVSATLLASVSAADADTYTSYAVRAIDTLNDEWYNVRTGIWDNAWWNSANFLTMLSDFALLRLDEANELNIGGYMRNTFVQAQKTNVQTLKTLSDAGMVSSTYCLDWDEGCMVKREFLGRRGYDDFVNEFYDDEGWWALALIRAYDAAGDQEYLDAAVDIFRDMQTGQGGPCGGGIFWNKERAYVNAITNELYLSVAASLANRIPQEPSYLDVARAQWRWFDGSGLINSHGLINDGLDGGCRNNGLQTWSYNQGVILGGLVELAIATGDTTLTDKATRIARSAIEALAGAVDRDDGGDDGDGDGDGDSDSDGDGDGVLAETDRCELRSGHCGRDGQTFKGVFVRNLRYLHEVAPQDEFRDFILRNADSIWAHDRNDRDMLGVSWKGPYVDATGATQSSALDVIVAAIAVA